MSNFIDSLFNAVPWLRPTLAWSVAFLLVFLILSVPAYYIFWPFLERARAQLLSFIRGLADRMKTARAERAERLNVAADEFLKDGGLWRLNSEAAGHWSALTARLVTTLKRLRAPVSRSATFLNELNKSVPVLQEEIHQLRVSEFQPFPELVKSEGDLVESAAELRVAWGRLVLVGMILLGLMLVNTGMLSQILQNLGVVASAIKFLGMPLAYVLAFILTLFEASIGVAHGISKERVHPDRLSILPTVITIFAVSVGFTEGFFYSGIAPSEATYKLPFLNYEMPQSNFFFFWGFVLVMTLFILGFFGYESFDRILHGSKSRTLRRHMNELQKQHKRYAGAVKRSEETLISAKAAANEADKVLEGPSANGESVRQELDRVWKGVETLRVTPPGWANDTEAALTRTDVHQLGQKGGIWLTLATFGMVVITITGLNSFRAFNPNLNETMLWVLAVGQAVLFFGVGFLLGAGETIVQGTGDERKVWAAPRFSRLGAYIVGGLLVFTYVVVFFVLAWPMGLGVVWFSNLMVGLFLIAAGYQLSPLLNVVRLWLWRVSNIVVFILEAMWLALLRLVHFSVVIMENIAYLMATPLDRFFRTRRDVRIDHAEISTEASRPSETENRSIVSDDKRAVIETPTN